MNRISVSTVVLLATLVTAQAAPAQSASPVTTTIAFFNVQTVTEQGKTQERLQAAPQSVQPGDVLYQELVITNSSARTLTNGAVPLNVPRSTTFLGGLVLPGGVSATYSYDGGKTFGALPLKRTVTVTENGKSVTRQVEVKPSEYTSVRFSLPALAAGTTYKMGYRVRVN